MPCCCCCCCWRRCSWVDLSFDRAATPRTGLGSTREATLRKRKGAVFDTPPSPRRRATKRLQPRLPDAACCHRLARQMWQAALPPCSFNGAPTTSKARTHNASVHPSRGRGGDGKNQCLVAPSANGAGRLLCPGEQRHVFAKEIAQQSKSLCRREKQRRNSAPWPRGDVLLPALLLERILAVTWTRPRGRSGQQRRCGRTNLYSHDNLSFHGVCLTHRKSIQRTTS